MCVSLLLSPLVLAAPGGKSSFAAFCAQDALRAPASEPAVKPTCGSGGAQTFSSVEELEKSVSALKKEIKSEKKKLKAARKAQREEQEKKQNETLPGVGVLGAFPIIEGKQSIEGAIAGSIESSLLDPYQFKAGKIPSSEPIGSVKIGKSDELKGVPLSASGPFGSLNLNVSADGKAANYSLTLSQSVRDYLRITCASGGVPFCEKPDSNVHVTDVAFDLGIYHGKLYGNVYIYLNGTKHGYTLTF